MSTAQPGQLTFERVFASPSLNGPVPRLAKLSPDGRFLTVLRNREDEKERYDLWAFDRDSGEWSMLVDSKKIGSGRELSEAEKMQRERSRVGSLKGIITYSWNADGMSILVPLDGDLYLAGLDGSVKRLTESEGSELNPALSPKGTYLSFVRDNRLFVGRLASEPQAITPSEGDLVHWGEAEFVAQEEMDRRNGYWWSPDETHIAVERFDESPVGVVTRAAIGASGTKTFDQRYPAAGQPNVDVALYVVSPDGASKVEVDLGSDPDVYLARVDWAPDGKTLYVQRINRLQDRLDMLKVDPATGKSSVLFSEHAADGHWINLTDGYRFLKDGSLVWRSERDGFGHLYRFANGKWQQLTKGAWVVTGLDGVDEDSHTLFFTATKDGVLAQQVYSLDYLKPREPKRLTDLAFSNGATMDGKGKSLLVSRSSPTQPTQTYLADGSGKQLAWVEQNLLDTNHPWHPYIAGQHQPEFGTIKGPDGSTLYWKMIKPDMVPGKRYPVFFSHYGGPHSQQVSKGWGGALQQAIVDQGYIWFEIDNRGSSNRGVAFEKQIYHAMGSVEVADQKAGGEYLKGLPFVDPDKIAIYGWSYGGYMTLKMLEADPGFYAVGISGAPVTKWELYDTFYTERYMGSPKTDPQDYLKSDALQDADRISDPMLLIHGLSDDNVVFENSSELIAKLQGDAVPFEMMLYPGQTHGVGGPKISVHLWHTIMSFLKSHGVTPPE
ncbi:prolyl oligopeptidase family serine peptidase [Altererythrobacter salegens]|uniref:Prolyl oligopeptidase family serine peptidase n=2 Tax=Croceibacterium salegens TaxID=1737568 RepID=A0A6I4SVP7_9SPHN|nr:S9 family peptidase [Croceibacterium salegens]MXO59130.1 prolyl oligopeptidase family serine peptidase [Croceibacterium salegens]